MIDQGKDAVQVLKEFAGDHPDFERFYQEARINSIIAQIVYDARMDAGVTQVELASLAGTSPQVISQLEDADYEGDTFYMIQKIATVLNRRIDMRLVPIDSND